jgi:hypothetical protein
MNRGRLLAAIGLLALQAAHGQDVAARAALDRALALQRTVPSFTEHVYARMPVMPGGIDTARDAVVERLKERALDAAQDKIAAATAQVPVAGDVIARGVAKARAEADVEPVFTIAWGPETEIMTTEHAGGRERRTMLGGTYEIVRAEGRMATRVSLRSQIVQMQLAVAASGYGVYEQARQVRETIKSIGSQLAQGGIGMVFGVVDALGQIDSLLGAARTTAQLARATALMEEMSGRWRCEPDPLDSGEFGKSLEVVQLDDDTMAHVYREVRGSAAPQASTTRPADPDDEPPGPFQIHIQTWVGIADGLPLRSVFELPGGHSQRIEYDYGHVAAIDFPACANPPSAKKLDQAGTIISPN